MAGRKIICESCGTIYKEETLGDKDICPVCGKSLVDDKIDNGLITWYYYLYSAGDGKTKILLDTPVNEDIKHKYTLIREFKAPPKDVNGNCDAAKNELRKYIPDAFTPAQSTPEVRCPICGSKEYTLLNKGFSLLTGFIGSNRIKRVCNYCKREF